MIFAIDPGNEESAFALLSKDLKPFRFAKLKNSDMMDTLSEWCRNNESHGESHPVCIEMVASYGMPVGKTVFDTCVFIGELKRQAEHYGQAVHLVYRKDEKMNLCHNMTAKDSNIRQALIDRFGEVGTKNNKGWFYGVSKDVWSAIAVGVTWADTQTYTCCNCSHFQHDDNDLEIDRCDIDHRIVAYDNNICGSFERR